MLSSHIVSPATELELKPNWSVSPKALVCRLDAEIVSVGLVDSELKNNFSSKKPLDTPCWIWYSILVQPSEFMALVVVALAPPVESEMVSFFVVFRYTLAANAPPARTSKMSCSAATASEVLYI